MPFTAQAAPGRARPSSSSCATRDRATAPWHWPVAFGAEVFEIASRRFSHGGTRNLLMERAAGDHVAFLTQDAVPADARWLGALARRLRTGRRTSGSSTAPTARSRDASLMVARELTDWFAAVCADGVPGSTGSSPRSATLPARRLLGPRASSPTPTAAVAREAWERSRSAGRLRRGPRARPRHAPRRVRQGVHRRRPRSCTPMTTRPGIGCAGASTRPGRCTPSTTSRAAASPLEPLKVWGSGRRRPALGPQARRARWSASAGPLAALSPRAHPRRADGQPS